MLTPRTGYVAGAKATKGYQIRALKLHLQPTPNYARDLRKKFFIFF